MIKTIPVIYRVGVFVPVLAVDEIAEESALEIAVDLPLAEKDETKAATEDSLEQNLALLYRTAGLLKSGLPADEVSYIVESDQLAEESIWAEHMTDYRRLEDLNWHERQQAVEKFIITITYRFDPIDYSEMRRWISLSPTQRLETMLNARELAVGFIRGQMSKRYPNLSWPALKKRFYRRSNGVTSSAYPNFNLFFAIFQTLEAIQVPYMIIGKLMAWAEGRSRKHETDIYEMLVMNALRDENEPGMDIPYIDTQAQPIGEAVLRLWQAIKAAVQQQST